MCLSAGPHSSRIDNRNVCMTEPNLSQEDIHPLRNANMRVVETQPTRRPRRTDPNQLDDAMRDIRHFIEAGTWGGVHILMALNKTAFATSKREDVIAFLADLRPRLEAARARAHLDGWSSKGEGNILMIRGR